jgi:hypothetical protein
MMDSETRKLLEEYGLTAYAIERQPGHVTEQAILALLSEAQQEACCTALERDGTQRSQRLDELGDRLARILTRLDDHQGVIRDARAEARREALEEAIQLAPKMSTVEEAGGLYTYFAGYIDCHKDYREAIRALISQEPQTPT